MTEYERLNEMYTEACKHGTQKQARTLYNRLKTYRQPIEPEPMPPTTKPKDGGAEFFTPID